MDAINTADDFFETRLKKLLPLLGSPNEPEALAALRAINALLLKHKRDWHWLAVNVTREAVVLTPHERMMREMDEDRAKQQAEAMRQRPADGEAQKAAAYVLAKGSVKQMHASNVAAFQRAAEGGIINGLERGMIMQSAERWRERDAHKLAVEYKAKRADPFWLAEWLVRANDLAKPFSQAERAFIDGVINGGRPSADDCQRLGKLERRVMRQRPYWAGRLAGAKP